MDRPGVVDREPTAVRAGRRSGGPELPGSRCLGRRRARLRADQAALGARRPLPEARGAVRRVRPARSLKFGGLLLKFKVVTTGASMLVSIAAYAWIWGLPVRDRVRAPDLRARARARARAAAPGRARERAALHPVPRRSDRDEGAARRRLEGGAGRARRTDPRLRRRGCVLDRRRGDRLGAPRRARVRRLLPQPLQPDPDRPARRRSRRRRAAPGALVRRAAA